MKLSRRVWWTMVSALSTWSRRTASALTETEFGEAPVELEVQGPGAGVQIQQGAGDELRTLDVVECKARAEEQVVLVLVGCAPAAPVDHPFGEQAEVGVRPEHAVEGVFAAADEGRVGLLVAQKTRIGQLADSVAGALAIDCLQLEQPGLDGKLGVEPELPDLLVVRRQDNPGRAERHEPHDRFPTGAVEHAEPEIERPEGVAVAGGDIEMPFPRPALVGCTAVVDFE